jgi:hypothetical protein
VLKTLVLTRFAQRILVNDWLTRENTGRPADPAYHAGVSVALEGLL